MIILDGKSLAQKIKAELKTHLEALPKPLRLAIVMAGRDPATVSFVMQKKKFADSIGVEMRIHDYENAPSTDALRKDLARVVHDKKNSGVIVQLPLPTGINTQYVLNAVPPEKDVDMLSARSAGNFLVGKSPIKPPVVAAIKMLMAEHKIEYLGKEVVIVGSGKLVGRPMAIELLNEGVTVSVVNSRTPDIADYTKRADIIISGAGRPRLITGEMIKSGSVLIDAGSSESAGKIVGDVDAESVAEKASGLAPVPGGVGPVTVAMLFKNLVLLSENHKK